jgi:hypothetical protein
MSLMRLLALPSNFRLVYFLRIILTVQPFQLFDILYFNRNFKSGNLNSVITHMSLALKLLGGRGIGILTTHHIIPGNTKGGWITLLLTSCFTGLN